MKTKEQTGKSQTVLNLLNEARAEADGLRARVMKLEQIILSTRLIMGHELKKPATAISGYLELALEEMDSSSQDRLEEKIQKARTECALLNELNMFFLELLKVDGGEEVLWGSKIELRDFVEKVLDHLPPSLDTARRVKTRIAPNINDFHTNPDAFKIILTNIIENALKYSSKDSEVLVDIRRAPDKRGMRDQELLRIRVTDHGVGIPEAHLKRIFIPFVRLHKDITEGSGLGLTLVRSLVELYGGDVYIKSTEKDGTTVHVTIPEADNEDLPRDAS
ncbi:MAG: HAMP domain-containing histidine kinase [Candidatus Krumholzibacteria bacterium]|nr:HAMP domain-containing histidine kinase [Candidatus Krumholzibacteria bacterium]